jgi:hypothetical protein
MKNPERAVSGGWFEYQFRKRAINDWSAVLLW